MNYEVDAEGAVSGVGLHDGYLYGLIQKDNALVIYADVADDSKREIRLIGLKEMNVVDFWNGTIICDLWLWERHRAPIRMWKELFKGRTSSHTPKGSLESLIESAEGRYFFALESSYGASVYALCDDLEIVQPTN